MRAVPARRQNPKSESRNPKQIRNVEYRKLETNAINPSDRRVFVNLVLGIYIFGFESVSDFGFEISDLAVVASPR